MADAHGSLSRSTWVRVHACNRQGGGLLAAACGWPCECAGPLWLAPSGRPARARRGRKRVGVVRSISRERRSSVSVASVPRAAGHHGGAAASLRVHQGYGHHQGYGPHQGHGNGERGFVGAVAREVRGRVAMLAQAPRRGRSTGCRGLHGARALEGRAPTGLRPRRSGGRARRNACLARGGNRGADSHGSPCRNRCVCRRS